MSPKLTDILTGADRDTIKSAWQNTDAAEDFVPLPAGEYVAHIVNGELFNAKTGTSGYKLTFKVIEGEHADRRFWHEVWLTPAAIPMAKRDLGKLGITDIDQLEEPLPQGIRVQAKVALRRDDDGNEYNRVRGFKVLGIDEPQQDAFAPDDNPEPEQTPSTDSDGESAEKAEEDDSFDFGHNRANAQGDGGAR